MSKLLKIFFLIFSHFECFSQCTSCKENIVELIQTIESDYSGYFTGIENNVSYYNSFKKKLVKQSRKLDVNLGCYRLMKNYLEYFNDPHLTMSYNFKNAFDSSFFKNDNSFNKVIAQLRKNKTDTFTLKETNYLLGNWIEDNESQISFKKLTDKIIVGKVTNPDFKHWFPDQVKILIYKKGNKFLTYYQNRDHYMRNDSVRILEGELVIGRFIRMFRKKNYFNEITKFNYKEYADSVGYLRVPNCLRENEKIFDSILNSNHQAILKKKKLIIDLRNNGGGSISVTNLLIPYCTNQYIRHGSKKRNNKFTKQDYLDLIEYYKEDSVKKNEYERKYNDLLRKGDDYLFGSVADTVYLDNYFDNPSNIYILINRKTGSAAEYFP